MKLLATHRLAGSLAGAIALAVGLSACGTTVSTSRFQGAQHEVAQAIADLQSHATAGEQKKICSDDLATSVTQGLGGKGGCEKAIKRALTETDNLELSVQSIAISTPAKGSPTATAQVKSTYKGKKNRPGTVVLVKEGGDWRISGVATQG